ncbi:hypothetical protein B296_00052983 [Ensete ventricosum]|uniref:Uncharacterized protein n=1 Tax=Ensete ventricosum TaxID=4639 RepID=A0A426X8T4_ENSVE|nr:hypothetical protein B296_00052983 [Ensete ventricosum]
MRGRDGGIKTSVVTEPHLAVSFCRACPSPPSLIFIANPSWQHACFGGGSVLPSELCSVKPSKRRFIHSVRALLKLSMDQNPSVTAGTPLPASWATESLGGDAYSAYLLPLVITLGVDLTCLRSAVRPLAHPIPASGKLPVSGRPRRRASCPRV